MSPHQTPGYQNVNEYINFDDIWLASTSTPSPLLQPTKDDIATHLTFGLHSSASQYPASPPRSPYIGPRSAPITFPIDRGGFQSSQMYPFSFSGHSFQDNKDLDLSGIDISGEMDSRTLDSPHASFAESYMDQNAITHHNSFGSIASSHTSEQFPSWDSEFPFSPVMDRKPVFPNNQMSRTKSVDSSVPMSRTKSVNSAYSQDGDDTLSFDAGSVCATVGTDIHDLSEFPFIPTGSPLSTRHTPAFRNTSVRMGRKRKLSAAQREATAYMRKVGACDACYKRKLKCDDGIPCRRCIKFYGNDLPNNPCRGKQLETVANFIMEENAFPRRDYKRFLADIGDYRVTPNKHRINLDLSFGAALPCEVHLVFTEDPESISAFFHKHIEYRWPPAEDDSTRDDRTDFVFPAVLADASRLEHTVEAYLSTLLDNHHNFQYFPIWNSQLRVLRRIYQFYVRQPRGKRSPLEQALKLLILIHVGGDVRVLQDEHSMQIVQGYVNNYNNFKVTPCFIRAQLGPVFSKISHRLMRAALTELEILSPNKDASTFPMVISTFSVLLMAMESLQYHFYKVPYHTHFDNPGHVQEQEREPTTRNLDDMDGAEILLRFYKATRCHESLGQIASDEPLSSSLMSADRDTVNFLQDLKAAAVFAKQYLEERLAKKVAPRVDMSSIFDRLLAKLYLMES